MNYFDGSERSCQHMKQYVINIHIYKSIIQTINKIISKVSHFENQYYEYTQFIKLQI